MNQLPEVTTDRGNTPQIKERQCWRDQGIGLPQAMGLGPLAQPLFYQYKCTFGRAEPHWRNRSRRLLLIRCQLTSLIASGPLLPLSYSADPGESPRSPAKTSTGFQHPNPAPWAWDCMGTAAAVAAPGRRDLSHPSRRRRGGKRSRECKGR